MKLNILVTRGISYRHDLMETSKVDNYHQMENFSKGSKDDNQRRFNDETV